MSRGHQDDDAGAPPFPQVLAGRYRLRDHLGSGGSGTVYLADDLVQARTVAVKLLRPVSGIAIERLRREILALQVLQVPGVARLYDHGSQAGRAFLVMEYVRGTPFPGPAGGDWAKLAPTVLALLEILGRMHAQGIVHRDLKPGNVLVDAAGHPWVLDFGLARGDALGSQITSMESDVGTPLWQAPEQMAGSGPVDARADLYAVGAMLYEALAGERPHPDEDLRRLYYARLMRDAPPLAWAAPHVAPEVARVVDQLLARSPDMRPRTASEVIARLRGAPDAGAELPRLGGSHLVEGLAAELAAGRPVDVAGPRGSGRTRLLRDVTLALERSGRGVARLPAAARPYASIVPVCGPPPAGLDGASVEAAMERRLHGLLAGGKVLVADDAETLDPWTRALLDRCRDAGPLLRAFEQGPPGAHVLRPLAVDDLRPLFAGPDRLLHLREDGARALFARTGGHPGRVAAEVAEWLSAGLARWKDGLLHVDRAAIDRLADGVRLDPGYDPVAAPLSRPLGDLLAWIALAWPRATRALLAEAVGLPGWELDAELTELARRGVVHVLPDGRIEPRRVALVLQEWPEGRRDEAHAALAAAIPPGGDGRLEHLIAAGSLGRAALEARVRARALTAAGKTTAALGVLGQGLAAARDAGIPDAERGLLAELGRVALADQGRAALEQARYELRRAQSADPGTARIARLVEAALARWRHDVGTAAALLSGLEPFVDPNLEGERRGLAVWLHFQGGPGFRSDPFFEAEVWAQRSVPSSRARLASWRAHALFREGRFAEAARLHVACADDHEDLGARLAARLDAAVAFTEASAGDEARAEAEQALACAREHRLPVYEARAEWALRALAYREGRATAPDLELVEAAGALDRPRLDAAICANEAAVAWRAGALDVAARLADRAAARWTEVGRTVPAALSATLGALCRGDADAAWLRARVDVALRHGPTLLALQTLGLAAMARPDLDPRLAGVAERLAARLDPASLDRRREVLSPAEAVEACARR